MTTIKFLGYDLELVEVRVTRLRRASLVSVIFKFNSHQQSFSARTNYTHVEASLSDIDLYNLIASDIEDEMTDWVNSLT